LLGRTVGTQKYKDGKGRINTLERRIVRRSNPGNQGISRGSPPVFELLGGEGRCEENAGREDEKGGVVNEGVRLAWGTTAKHWGERRKKKDRKTK